MAKTDYKTIDDFIAAFPPDDQKVFEKMRTVIKKSAPEAEEVISYQIPAFKYHGYLIYFSGYKNHFSIAFPPPWTVFEKFKKELSEYELSKSTVQFPKSKPIPYDLIEKMVQFRAEENKTLEEKKAKK